MLLFRSRLNQQCSDVSSPHLRRPTPHRQRTYPTDTPLNSGYFLSPTINCTYSGTLDKNLMSASMVLSLWRKKIWWECTRISLYDRTQEYVVGIVSHKTPRLTNISLISPINDSAVWSEKDKYIIMIFTLPVDGKHASTWYAHNIIKTNYIYAT